MSKPYHNSLLLIFKVLIVVTALILVLLSVFWNTTNNNSSQKPYSYESNWSDWQNIPSHDRVSLDITKTEGDTVFFILTNNSEETLYYNDSNCVSDPFAVFELRNQRLYRIEDRTDVICAVMPSKVPVAAGKIKDFYWTSINNSSSALPIRIEIPLINDSGSEYLAKTNIFKINE